MKLNRKKIFVIEIIILSVLFITGIAYSSYTADVEINTNGKIAGFIFNANKTDAIEIVADNLIPGKITSYTFSVYNNLNASVSEVTIEYQIILKTIHSIPLTYELLSIDGVEESVLTCNENNTRNAEGILECKSPIMTMSYNGAVEDQYKLNVIFPSMYNDVSYANLIDYLDIEIESWQKIN